MTQRERSHLYRPDFDAVKIKIPSRRSNHGHGRRRGRLNELPSVLGGPEHFDIAASVEASPPLICDCAGGRLRRRQEVAGSH